MSTTSEILREAATEVRRHWGQGTMVNEAGGVCAAAAILGLHRPTADWRLMGFPTARQAALTRFVEVLQLPVCEATVQNTMTFYYVSSHELRPVATREIPLEIVAAIRATEAITRWNDAKTQRAEDVATALEFAALVCEVEEQEKYPAPTVWVDAAGLHCRG